MVWWNKSSTVSLWKVLTLPMQVPLHTPSSKTPMIIKSPTTPMKKSPFSVVIFPLLLLLWKTFFEPIMFFSYFLFQCSYFYFSASLSCLSIESVLPEVIYFLLGVFLIVTYVISFWYFDLFSFRFVYIIWVRVKVKLWHWVEWDSFVTDIFYRL